MHEHAAAKVHVFSKSVLCVGGRIAEYPQSVNSWTYKIEWFTHTTPCREPDRTDGKPVVFEWKIFPGHTTLKLLREVQNTHFHFHVDVQRHRWEPKKKTMKKVVNAIPQESPNMPERVPKDIQWSFLGPGCEEKWYATLAHKPNGLWDKVAEELMILFAECGHPAFRGTTSLSRGLLRSKGGGKTSIHSDSVLSLQASKLWMPHSLSDQHR